jgi:hemerythrin-like domain-containing protein
MSAHASLTIIHQEHGALSAMLRTLTMLLAEHRRRQSLPDFALLRAMLFYIDEFPEKLHHTKESQLLFPKLRARSLEAREVLDRLDRDHARGERAIRDLEHDLLAFEIMGPTSQQEERRSQFEQSVQRYVDFYLEHMRLEETEVLPLAERVLTAEDWNELDAAFQKNRDPLTGHAPDDAYVPLFRRIVSTLPAPLGLGPALEALSTSGTAKFSQRH